jgi:DNA repair ATPase RecN
LTKKIRNQKNNDQIKKYNILQTGIEGLEWKETKILCKSQWTKIKNQKKKDQITSTKTQRRLIDNFLKKREKRKKKKGSPATN